MMAWHIFIITAGIIGGAILFCVSLCVTSKRAEHDAEKMYHKWLSEKQDNYLKETE